MSYLPPYEPPMPPGSSGIGNAGYPGGYPLPQRRLSAAAVTSLVTGLLLCVPILTALIALLSGMIGVGATGAGGKRGRGLAVAGVILGLLNLLLWVGGGTLVWKTYGPTVTPIMLFEDGLATGNAPAALSQCDANVSSQQVQDGIATFKAWGAGEKMMHLISYKLHAPGGGSSVLWSVSDSNGQTHTVSIHVVEDNGVWKVDSFELK